jgi:cytochrome c oxidase subunit 4
MTRDDWAVLRRVLRVPALTLVALMALLAINVALGATLPFRNVWIVEAGVAACMVAIVLLVSMDLLDETPLIRLFSSIGFFWMLIMFGMTLTDYLYR